MKTPGWLFRALEMAVIITLLINSYALLSCMIPRKQSIPLNVVHFSNGLDKGELA